MNIFFENIPNGKSFLFRGFAAVKKSIDSAAVHYWPDRDPEIAYITYKELCEVDRHEWEKWQREPLPRWRSM